MSSDVFARLNVALSFAGLYIAGMLSLSHLMGIELPCGVGTGCDLVTQDARSQFLGVPIAYYGLLGYSVIASIALLRLFAPGFRARLLHSAGYGLSFAGLLTSIALTWFSVRSLHALCTWCIASAVTMSLLFASHALASTQMPPVLRKRPLDPLWVVILGCVVLAGVTSQSFDLKKAAAKSIYVDRAALDELSDDELLPDDAHITGPKTAHATVVMFGDLTCPVCHEAYEYIHDLMQRRHDFRFAFRQLPLAIHPLARPAALVSEMAGEKGRFWEFVGQCYEQYPSSVGDVIDLGAKTGLDPAVIRKRMKDPDDPAADVLARDAEVEQKLGLTTTPSVFILIDGYYPEPIAYRGIETMLDSNTAVKRTHG